MALEDAKNQVDMAFTRDDPRGLAFENAFGGATSFLRRRYTKDLSGVDLAVTGVPFDQGVTHRPGTRFGPRAIREASTLRLTSGGGRGREGSGRPRIAPLPYSATRSMSAPRRASLSSMRS